MVKNIFENIVKYKKKNGKDWLKIDNETKVIRKFFIKVFDIIFFMRFLEIY